MTRFEDRQRIRVVEADDGRMVGRTGTVKRLRMSDDGAWVRMDASVPPEVRQFPEPDARCDDIVLYPECCEPLVEHA